jgi:hypothetical protein
MIIEAVKSLGEWPRSHDWWVGWTAAVVTVFSWQAVLFPLLKRAITGRWPWDQK